MTITELDSACDNVTHSQAFLDWDARGNQVIDYLPSDKFRQRMQQDSDQQAATLKRLGLTER